ncbi:MAG: hypothetical protein KDB27_22505, partial [Planctomycetales bacterium]|nr:hypothetical protein [Planctomycetales bacterium]
MTRRIQTSVDTKTADRLSNKSDVRDARTWWEIFLVLVVSFIFVFDTAKLNAFPYAPPNLLLIAGPTEETLAETHAESAQGTATAVTVGFEDVQAGPFAELQTGIGVWKPEAGRTIVDNEHAKTGQQCLQLMGAAETSVILELADDADTSGELTFWAERWTKRTPFSFRVEKESGNGWKEIYNGDREVRVGRAFLTHIKVPLGDDE